MSGQFLVSILGWVKEARFAGEKRRRDAEYLAIRLVLCFEDLVGASYNAVHDPLATDEKGCAVSTVSLPALVLLSDADYRALPAQLMYEVLSMPNRLDGIKEGLSAVSEHTGPPDYDEYFEYRRKHLSALGLRALNLIDVLCSTYKIPPPERPEFYTPRESFQDELEKIEKQEQVREAENRDMWERMEVQAKGAASQANA